MNIKNEATLWLAARLAELAGETTTGAITAALRERLDREERLRGIEARTQELLAINVRCADLLADGPSSEEHGEFLYDDRGLPR